MPSVSKSAIDDIAQLTKVFLQQEIDDLRINAAKLSSSTRKERLRGREASLLILDGFTQKLPDSFEFFLHPANPVALVEHKRLRDRFNENARKSILKQSIREEEHLRQMGLTSEHLTSLRQGRVPRTSSGKLLDLTVDHIVELSNGGTNDRSNLCILPGYFNLYKCTFTQLQIRTGLKEILGVRPKSDDGKVVLVPFLKHGFSRATHHGPTIRKRMENLLEMKLENI